MGGGGEGRWRVVARVFREGCVVLRWRLRWGEIGNALKEKRDPSPRKIGSFISSSFSLLRCYPPTPCSYTNPNSSIVLTALLPSPFSTNAFLIAGNLPLAHLSFSLHFGGNFPCSGRFASIAQSHNALW